ncbi:cyclohexanone monooxygenase [Trichoderma asperellum]
MSKNVHALVVGAGFSGIYQLYKLRELGLSVKLVEAAPEVGGTWYWNRYPGATSDTHSEVYRYSWDKEDLLTYPWTNRYLPQAEIQAYLKHAVRRHDLAKDIQLNTHMESAQYIEGGWEIRLSTGESFRSRYLVTALGALSKAYFPQIPGLDSFAGEMYYTTAWPTKHDFFNKRVGVIGNGSTGVQLIITLAGQSKQLISFQRHPQHVIPNDDGKVTEEDRKRINDTYDQIWHNLRTNLSGHAIIESSIPTMSVNAEEPERVFEQVWQSGNGITFLFGTFGDIAIDEEANSEASDFIRRKIAQIVKDPVKARKLTPPGGFNRRPVTANGYYETFNRDNVDVVDVLDAPMEITPTDIKLSDSTKYDLDVIVFATGFEAVDGMYHDVSITGREGLSVHDHWADGTKSFLATNMAGFPNMFLINGPQGPLTNVPPLIET